MIIIYDNYMINLLNVNQLHLLCLSNPHSFYVCLFVKIGIGSEVRGQRSGERARGRGPVQPWSSLTGLSSCCCLLCPKSQTGVLTALPLACLCVLIHALWLVQPDRCSPRWRKLSNPATFALWPHLHRLPRPCPPAGSHGPDVSALPVTSSPSTYYH